jgi:DNA repair protein SbcD/Mre11
VVLGGFAMSTFKFLHAADLHLDSPLLGLAAKSTDFAERVEEASRRAFDNLVDLAITESCRFVVFAGDIFDRDLRNMRTGLFFVSRIRRLTEAGIGVFMVLGNHDAENAFIKKLEYAGETHIFSARKAETVWLEDIGIAIHGQSFPRNDVREDLARDYPAPVRDLFNVGVLHTACKGKESYHAPYAPCSAEQLINHGYQYWALGHVHASEVLNKKPYVVYSGNLQGRDPREIGPKGAMLVQVDDGEVTHLEHRALDLVRWARLEVNTSVTEDVSEVLTTIRSALQDAVQASNGRTIAVRLALVGRSALHGKLRMHHHDLRDDILSMAAAISDEIWLERFRIDVEGPVAAAPVDASIAGLIANEIHAVNPEDLRLRLEKTLNEVRDKMPAGARVEELFSRLRDEAPARSVEIATALLTEVTDAY